MVGRASWAEGLQQGLQEGDVTQEMPPGGRDKHPRCLAGGRGQEQRALRWGLGAKEPRWAAQQRMEGSPRRGQWGSVGGPRLQEEAGLLWGTDRHPGG